MDRRHFLVLAARTGLAVGGLAALDAVAHGPPFPVAPVPAGAAGTPGRSASPGAAIAAASAAPSPARPPASLHDDRIVVENLRPGDRGWDPIGQAVDSQAEGFALSASVAAGDEIGLRYGTVAPLTIDWYRLGWYGGAGGRLVHSGPLVRGRSRFGSTVDPITGRAEATGGSLVTVQTDRDWLPGQYVAVLRPTDRSTPRWVPVTIRPAAGAAPAPILFVSATATWQAYNTWGGANFYTASNEDDAQAVGRRRATQISFDRPLAGARGLGLMPRWELNFIRWQERAGYPVDYCADVDLELHPEVLNGRRLILFVGHHEYWSRPMRSSIESAIAAGTNVAFLEANEVYWQTRLEDSPTGPGRRVTCYKSAQLDPVTATHPELATCRFREPPVNDPEAPLIGQMYGAIVSRVADWVVADAGHWIYERTRVRDGDRIRNLVGQEFDTFFPDLAHPRTAILARSPVVPTKRRLAAATYAPEAPDVHNATCYEADSGATVVAAGTFQWSWALDDYGDRSYRGVATPVDPRVGVMTRNILDRLG
jgi:N,N-dimethylformamidase beta subunit-like protein